MTRKTIDLAPFRHLYPFQSHFLDIDGLQYHYLDEGNGEAVVMLHGNPTWSFYFRGMVQALSPEYRVIVPDHMGCGLSDAPPPHRYGYRLENRVNDLESLLERLAPEGPLTLMVHDWGGMIGLCYALRHPERIGRLIITNTAAFFPPGDKGLPLRLRLIRNLAPFAVPAVLGLNLFSRAALYMAPRRRLSRPVRIGLSAPYNTPARRMATLKFVQDIPLAPGDPSYPLVRHVADHLDRLSMLPMLILWGLGDFVFDRDYLAEWQRRFPQAAAHVFSDAGHYLFEDKCDTIAPIVKEFLKNH
jgi:haloalkane dehalogenase